MKSRRPTCASNWWMPGVKVPFMASDGAFLSATIDESEGAAEGIYLSNFAPEPRAVVQAHWIKAYQDVELRNPDTYSINGYSAMKVLVEGAKKAGTLDGPRVADAIRALDITTPMGKVAYDRQRRPEGTAHLYLPGEGWGVRAGRAVGKYQISNIKHQKRGSRTNRAALFYLQLIDR